LRIDFPEILSEAGNFLFDKSLLKVSI